MVLPLPLENRGRLDKPKPHQPTAGYWRVMAAAQPKSRPGAQSYRAPARREQRGGGSRRPLGGVASLPSARGEAVRGAFKVRPRQRMQGLAGRTTHGRGADDASSGLAGLVAVSRDRARAAPRSRATWARVHVERSADRQAPVRDGSAHAVGPLPDSHSDDDPAAPRWMLRPTRLSARIRTSRHFGDEALGGAAHERAPAGPPLGS